MSPEGESFTCGHVQIPVPDLTYLIDSEKKYSLFTGGDLDKKRPGGLVRILGAHCEEGIPFLSLHVPSNSSNGKEPSDFPKVKQLLEGIPFFRGATIEWIGLNGDESNTRMIFPKGISIELTYLGRNDQSIFEENIEDDFAVSEVPI